MVEDLQGLDRTFAALSDPPRRAILARLAEGSATVGEVAKPFEMSLNGISKHVQVLERAGLVERVVMGREHRLHLRAEPLRAASDWTTHYRAFWEGRMDALTRLLEKKSGSKAPKKKESS